jgi:predicted TIM-barrel fold metal-dependent hydrolase
LTAEAAIKVIDADTHLTEPPDLWSARLPGRYSDRGPRVEVERSSGLPRWTLGGRWLAPVGRHSAAGWKEHYSTPPTFEEVLPACYDPKARLQWMDEQGIFAQVLYPNLVAFEGHALMALHDRQLELAIIRTYNDYVLEVASAAPDRFVPIASLPFWDRDESVKELRRCRDNGHRGLLWADTLAKHGLPTYSDPYWDPVYAAAQELEMSVNFHIGIGQTEADAMSMLAAGAEIPQRTEWVAINAYMSNAATIAHLIMSGLCDRFPRLRFVSVESGFGYVPYLLEALDWAFVVNYNGPATFPGRLLPSEYFRRQIYTMFWFEQTTLPLLEGFADNVMFETDFPHGSSLSPGPGSNAPAPWTLISSAIDRVGVPVMQKVLHDTAARVYGLP